MSLTQEQIKNLLVQRKATGENEILYRVQLTGNYMPGMLEVVVDGIARFFGSTDDMYLPPKPPKYDPNRKFRKRDKVRMKKELAGRNIAYAITEAGFSIGSIYEVLTNENHRNVVKLLNDNGIEKNVDWMYLELVTPVEELEPYYTALDSEKIDGDTVGFWAVRDEHDDTVAKFYVELYRADGAQQAAEAECDRLNEEHRKEQSNG